MDHSQNNAYGMGQNTGANGRIDLDNYIPEPNKGSELRRRLYDSGISNVPMPSVKRPIEENISSKPFSAKMNSSKIQALSPLKKKIQDLNTNIISNLNESYKEAAIQEAKYKGEGTADYYSSQHIIIPQPTYIKPSTAGRKLQGRMGVSVGQPRMTGQLINRKPQHLEPLQPAEGKRQNPLNQSMPHVDPGKIMQGPPSLVYAGFEGGASMSQKNLEQARSKYLLDKLTGKLPPELRQGTGKKLQPINAELQQSQSSFKVPEKEKEQAVSPQVITDLTSENSKKPKKAQKWSDLDKYIELLLDSKSEEETVFVYLVPHNPSDPYDLEVVDFNERDGKDKNGNKYTKNDKYYTLSGKGLTTYINDKPQEFHSLGQWLIERDSYNHIKDLSFFKQFKTWKFMRSWRRNIKMKNKLTSINKLEENLFMLQDHFRDHLAKHRSLMLDMSQKRFVDTLTTAEPKTIDQFATAQVNCREEVTKKITEQSDKARQNIQECINKVLRELRQRILGEITLDEQRKKDHPQPKNNSVSMKRKENNNNYDKLGFPAGMTYAHRSSLRKECSRFLRFAYLVDFLAYEALSQIYIGSLEKMIDRITLLDDTADMEMIMTMVFDETNQAGQAPRGSEPMFLQTVSLNDNKELPSHEIVEVKIDDFVLPPRGTSVDEDFDLLAHIEKEEPKDPNAPEEEEESNYGDEDDGVPEEKFQLTAPNIQNYWIKLEPGQEAFCTAVIKTFVEGLSSIKCFERWSKHSDLEDYANALEDWDKDDLVGEDFGKDLESTALDPQTWIADNIIQKTHEDTVRKLIASAFEKSNKFLTRFQPLLEIYWRNKQFDINILVDELCRNPVDALGNTLKLLKFYQVHFAANLPNITDIGLVQLNSQTIKKKLAPTPKTLQESVEELVPRVNKQRTDEVKVWLNQSIRDLQKPVNDVSDFVKQKQDHERISEKFGGMRDKIDLYGQFYSVLDDLGMQKLKKDDKTNHTEAEMNIKKLTDIIQNVESKIEQETERFKKELQEMIPTLNMEVSQLHEDAVQPQYLDKNSDMNEMIRQLDDKMAVFKKLEETGVKYNEWQEHLNTPTTNFDNIDDLREEVTSRHLLWHSLSEWQGLKDVYEKTLFVEINDKEIAEKADYYAKIANRLDKSLPSNPIQVALKEMVETFKGAMPIVTALRAPELTESHWNDINNLIDGTINVEEEGFTLQSLINLDVVQYMEEIQAISNRAKGEAKLKDLLAKVQAEWRLQIFLTVPHKSEEGMCQLTGVDDLYQFLDDNMANVNSILGNRFAAIVRNDAESTKKELQKLDACLEEWMSLQRQWVYLENIFKGQEIRKALPQESDAFQAVDRFFRTLMMSRVAKTFKCKGFLQQHGRIVDELKQQNAQLDYIQKQLQKYLETKRDAFPRFYFLSDDELLDILANSDNREIIQGYLKALFDGLVKLDMPGDDEIKGMISREGEKIEFTRTLRPSGNVEDWLKKVQQEMRDTLLKRLKDGNKDITTGLGNNKIPTPREKWVLAHPAQVVTTIGMVVWCSTTEEIIGQMYDDPLSLGNWYDQNVSQLEQLTILIRGKLDKLQRATLVALITQDVHARDIIDQLKQQSVMSVYEFAWQQQLRFYYSDDPAEELSPFTVKQIQATLQYGYEYMGATTRLVITPLTDKCWITITGALHIKLGANPAGPAGTGKTESTKDLAKAIAIYCVVYNCSDQVDYLMMQRHLSGLAQQGCWTCLDEFNRINVEVLSVIAQQLSVIRKALLGNITDPIDFEGTSIVVKPEFGCHITMNPGYAGRTELPDNLKVCFRPVAMMIPNYGLIAEIMLFGEGFGDSSVLSKKMVQLYKLSSEQLSQQNHYDFGMRAVKSVLVMAGELKRAHPNDPEDVVLIRAMKDANEPKFLKDDIPLFQAIVQDLFPTAEIQQPDYSFILKEIKKVLVVKGLQPQDKFMAKVIQLFETFIVRFGVMLVGFTGSGKTKCYETLADLMNKLRNDKNPDERFQNVVYEVINPKAISMGELYGEVDFTTQEWSDGLASKMIRANSILTDEDRQWTVFDGPVDALWIENMNTVLDDNMTLCLANGQRLKLRPQMRMLFEVQDLAVASPATVSRCGMVYLTAQELGWKPYVRTWMDKRFPADDISLDQELKDHLWETFEQTIDHGIEKVRSSLKEPITTDDLQLVKGVCNFLTVMIDPQKGFRGDNKQKKNDLERLISFSFTWGLGAALDEKSKDAFDTCVRDIFKACQYPQGFTVFDYFFDLKKSKAWVPWDDKVPQFQYSKEKSFFELFVDTSITYRHSWCLETLLEGNFPVFFTGDSGVGKSVVVQNTFNKLVERNTHQGIYLNFSAQTDSKRTQITVVEKLEKISRNTLGAPPGKKNVVFVDDINMPLTEFYGAQPPIELLRLFLDKQGLYERTEWAWKNIIDTTLVAAAAPPVGGRSPLTPRFSTHFNIFCVPQASSGVLQKIFGSILGGFLKAGFQEPIQSLCESAVISTIEIYEKISAEKRATPVKFHYLFNLRDVSKVIQGILMTKPVSINDGEVFSKLWAHEICRVFCDRLIDKEDTDWFIEQVMEKLNGNFKSSLELNDLFGETKIMFADVLKLDAPIRLYEEIRDKNKLIKQLNSSLEDYNFSSSNKMNLVFFEDAVLHTLRIVRSLRQPRGNIMLIGVGGSGKQSLTRMGSHMYEMEYKQIEIVKGYGQKHFNEFIKERMFETGIDGRKVTFTMTDSQILQESFLEDINNILNTGEVPNLMLQEDKDKIESDVRPIVIDMKLEPSGEIIKQFFVERVRENLHIALCMSPVGDDLRIRCRQFPSLVNCCTLDWFNRWNDEALLFVSTAFLKDLELPDESIRAALADISKFVHVSVENISNRFWDELRRRVFTTPKSYLDLISLYLNVLEQKRNEFNANKNRLSSGLNKLNTTNTQIAELKEKLKEMQPILVKKNEELKVTLEKVSADKAIADQKEAVVMSEKEIVEKQTAEAKEIQMDAENDLREAEPKLQKAKQAVAALTKESIVELKALTNPPADVVLVMEPVMILLGQKKDWANARKQMQDAGKFLELLQSFDVAKVTEKTLKKVRTEYFSQKNFNPEFIRGKSVPAGHLCTWIKALSDYQIVHKNVEPKKIKLKEQTEILKKSQAILGEKEAEVKKVKDKVAELQANADQLTNDKEELENNMRVSSGRMTRAEKLVVLLADEGVRWKETVAILEVEINNLVGDVFLSCASISYFGGFSGVYRKALTDSWEEEAVKKKIPCTQPFSLIKVMGDPMVMKSWNMNGLPSDQTSLENGILAMSAERWGLCIDPQEQANKWLKNMFKQDNLQILKFGPATLLRDITNSVRNGNPVMIQEIEEIIDPAIDPILLHQEFMADGGIKQIKLGDSIVDYDPLFKLYMTTKMPNPNYTPEVCIKVTLINFTVTQQGLEEQMLADVVIKERPEVEKKRDEIIVQMDKDSKSLKKIENNILKLLNDSELEQILDEDTLINVLDESKVTSKEINERMAQAEIVNKEISETRAKYTSVAIRGAILYFVIADMGLINDMYQNSLQFVKALFNKAIDASPTSDELDTRLSNLIDTITRNIYSNISRGLFEDDKLIFTYLISTSIDRYEKLIDAPDWNLLLRGAQPFTKDQKDRKPPNPLPKSITPLNFDLLYSTQCLVENFSGIIDSIAQNQEDWTTWGACEDPLNTKLPGEWEEKLSDFQKQIVIKVFRAEKLMFTFKKYVNVHMGEYFTTPIAITMDLLYKDTDPYTPLIFILSTGADPMAKLITYAQEKGMYDNVETISLGQGQGKKALTAISDGMESGKWVVLQNCHLSEGFMPQLAKVVGEFRENENMNEGFRLFLTSMPVPFFPVAVLQNGIKNTTEPPRGLKANLMRSWAETSDDFLDNVKKPDVWRKLCFGVSFFHAIAQERRKFGPLGFNVKYEFNDSDLDTSYTMLKIFLEEQDEIPWEALLYVTGKINYGGRVTDDKDLRCVSVTLEKYYNVDALNDDYEYEEGGIYKAPTYGTAQSYRDYIAQLPPEDAPGVFGLHANANITYQMQQSNIMVDKILSIQPRIGGGGGGLTPEQIVLERQKAILAEIPGDLEKANGLKELFKKVNDLLPSLTTVLVQEMEKFNRLLRVMRSSLIDLEKAIFGFILMSETLDEMFLKLQNGQVPGNWAKVAYPSLKPLASWFTDLKKRVEFMEDWLTKGNPSAYWLPGMYFPQGFLTGVLQTHARKHRVAIDLLSWQFTIEEAEQGDEMEEAPEDGVYIYGLYMDGASYNRDLACIDEQEPAVLYDPFPVIHFLPMKDYVTQPDHYQCPLYKTSARHGVLSTTGMSTNFVLFVDIPTNTEEGVFQPPNHWVRRAAAMLCQLDD